MILKRLGLGYMLFGMLMIWAAGVIEQEQARDAAAAAARVQRDVTDAMLGCERCGQACPGD